MTPGGRLETKLVASDPDGDPISFNIPPSDALPNTVLKSDGTLVIAPDRNQLGTFNFIVQASDGASVATRQVTVNIGAVQGLTQADGSFILDLGSGPVVADTLKVGGELFTGNLAYPFIAEKYRWSSSTMSCKA